QAHSTLLLEHGGVKIGFMALYDKETYDKLMSALGQIGIDYVDFVHEANRLCKQLRQSGASVIVALTNMHARENESRLMDEAKDLDIIFASSSESVCFKNSEANTWFVNS